MNKLLEYLHPLFTNISEEVFCHKKKTQIASLTKDIKDTKQELTTLKLDTKLNELRTKAILKDIRKTYFYKLWCVCALWFITLFAVLILIS